MKVVASTKLTRAERAMKQAKKYGAANEGESRVSYPGIGCRNLKGKLMRMATLAVHRALQELGDRF
jgi:hypothetical protein